MLVDSQRTLHSPSFRLPKIEANSNRTSQSEIISNIVYENTYKRNADPMAENMSIFPIVEYFIVNYLLETREMNTTLVTIDNYVSGSYLQVFSFHSHKISVSTSTSSLIR